MRIASFNVNGIRATQRRGFETWLATRGCDVVALQEVRCPAALLPDGVFGDYHLTYDQGSINGRNGVAVLTQMPPVAVRGWGAGVLVRAPGESHLDLTDPYAARLPLPLAAAAVALQPGSPRRAWMVAGHAVLADPHLKRMAELLRQLRRAPTTRSSTGPATT